MKLFTIRLKEVMNIRKIFKSKKLIIIFTIIFLITSVISTPKKAQANGLDWGMTIGGLGMGASALGALGTIGTILATGGLVIVGGAALYYLGSEIYQQYQTNKLIDEAGNVIVNQQSLDIAESVINNYDAVSAPAKPYVYTGALDFRPIAEYPKADGSTGSIPIDGYAIGSIVVPIETIKSYTVYPNLRFDYDVPASGIFDSVIGKFQYQVDSIVRTSSYSGDHVNGYEGKTIVVTVPSATMGLTKLGTRWTIEVKYKVNFYNKVTGNLITSGLYQNTFGQEYGMESLMGVPLTGYFVPGTGVRNLESVSEGVLAPPIASDWVFDKHLVREHYGNEAIDAGIVVSAPADWVKTYNPADTTKVFNPADVPTTVTDAPAIPVPDTDAGFFENLFNKLWEWLKKLWEAITSIPSLIVGLWELLKTLLQTILEWIMAIPAAIAAVPSAITDWIQQRINSPPKIPLLPQLFLNIILILLALIAFFVAVIAYILSIRSILADPSLLPPLVQQGITFTKNIRFPVFNMTLYTIVTTTLFIFIVIRVVGMLRKSIHARFG